MKKIKLWTCTEDVNIETANGPAKAPFEFNAKQVLISSIGQQRAQGYTIAEMRQRMQVMDKLEAAEDNGEIELTDEQVGFLAQSMSGLKFTIASINILNLAESLG